MIQGTDDSIFVETNPQKITVESSDLREFSVVNDLVATDDYQNSGVYSAYSNTDGLTGTYAEKSISAQKITKFEYYWRETSGSTGGGIQLRNSNGNIELGLTSDNPQWYISDANGNSHIHSTGTYGIWIRFTVKFDWANGVVDFEGENVNNGNIVNSSSHPLKAGVDVSNIEIWNFNTGTTGFGDSNNSFEMWFDDILYVPEATTQAIKYDGSSSYIAPADTTELHDAFSYRQASSYLSVGNLTTVQTIFDEGGATNGFFVGITSTGDLKLSVRDGGTENNITTPWPTDGAPHTFTAIFENGNLELIIDGDSKVTGTSTYTSISSHGGNPGIARTTDSSSDGATSTGQYLAGTMSEFQIISDAGIEYDYQLDSGSGTTAVDSSGYNRDGTINGGTWTTITDETVPHTPYGLNTSNVTTTSVDLSWVGEALAYDVHSAEASGLKPVDYAIEANPTTESYTSSSLENGEQYFYRVSNDGQDEMSDEESIITPLPAPSNLQLGINSNDYVTVNWDHNDNSTDGDRVVYRSTTSGTLGSSVDTSTDLTDTYHSDNTVNPDTTYYYTVRRRTDHRQADTTQKSITTPKPVVDSFEDQDLAEYNLDQGTTSNYSFVTSPVYDGTYALQYLDSNVEANSQTGLDNYLDTGETMSVWFRAAQTTKMNIRYYGTDFANCYFIRVTPGNDQLVLYKLVSHSATKIGGGATGNTLSTNTWYELRINPTSSDVHNADIYDGAGTNLGSIAPTDTTYTGSNTGIGFDAYLASGETATFDNARIL